MRVYRIYVFHHVRSEKQQLLEAEVAELHKTLEAQTAEIVTLQVQSICLHVALDPVQLHLSDQRNNVPLAGLQPFTVSCLSMGAAGYPVF